VTSAAHDAAERLFAALGPDMGANPLPEFEALWFAAKLLAAAAGDLDSQGKPAAEQRRERWEEVATDAAIVVDKALTVVADGLSLQQASERLLDHDSIEQDVADTARAYAGVVELTSPDFMDTERTLTVTVKADLHRSVLVTADRGAAPQPREHTAATLFRASHHLHQLGKTLGEVVLEPGPYGIPMCGPASRQITCAICQSVVGADVARTVEIYTPWPRQLNVCSTTCARAAAAGEHADLD
jgi:hypothetical protein